MPSGNETVQATPPRTKLWETWENAFERHLESSGTHCSFGEGKWHDQHVPEAAQGSVESPGRRWTERGEPAGWQSLAPRLLSVNGYSFPRATVPNYHSLRDPKQQKSVLSQFWRTKAQNQDIRAGSFWKA